MIGYIHPTLDKLIVDIDGLVPYGKNPRKGDVKRIAESLENNGQYKPIVVRAGTNEVLAGNHTLKAAKSLKWEKIAVTFVDVDDDAAARIVLADNRTSDLAEYDDKALAELLAGLPSVEGTGFNQTELDDLIYGLDQTPAATPSDADELPPQPDPISKPGDVFNLGRHKVICGSATDPRDLEALMGAERADCMWTDPPYGVDYVGKTADALTIKNDGAQDLDALLTDAFAEAVNVLRPGAPVYVAHSDTRRVTFENTMLAAGFLVRQNLIWVKNTMVLGHSDYQWKHEPILEGEAPGAEPAQEEGKGHDPLLYGFAPNGTGRLGRGGPNWLGPNNATTVFEFPKPPRNAEHPTMKPTDLIIAMLTNSVRQNSDAIVLDPFGGSGSTLIAAHYHGCIGRVVELDPRYVDVICARYQKLTGEVPTREDGTEVSFYTAPEEE